jgi:hypothetical protein
MGTYTHKKKYRSSWLISRYNSDISLDPRCDSNHVPSSNFVIAVFNFTTLSVYRLCSVDD